MVRTQARRKHRSCCKRAAGAASLEGQQPRNSKLSANAEEFSKKQRVQEKKVSIFSTMQFS